MCLLHDTGVKTIVLTFDGAAANFSVAKNLGCKLNADVLQPWFFHPVTREKVYIYSLIRVI